MEHSSSNWPWCHGDKALSTHLYDESLLRHANGYSQYDREMLKRTMIEHEATFRKQVYELHRLYRIQKQLMDELKRREVQKHCGTCHSNLFPFHHSSDDTDRLWQKRNFCVASGHATPGIDNFKSHLMFLESNCKKFSQMSVKNLHSSVKNVESVDFKLTSLPRKKFDLELPAEMYIDIEDDVEADKESKSAFKVSSSNFPIYTDNANDFKITLRQSKTHGCMDTDKKVSFHSGIVLSSLKLADLNEPIKVSIWEEKCLAYALVGGANSEQPEFQGLQKPSDRSLLFMCNHQNDEISSKDESVQSITGAWIGQNPSPQMPLHFSIALQSDNSISASWPISFWRNQDITRHELISVSSENSQSVGFKGKLASCDNGFHQNLKPDYGYRDNQGSEVFLYTDLKQPSFLRTKRARNDSDNLEASTSQLISNPNAHDPESNKLQNKDRGFEKILQLPTSENIHKCPVDVINLSSSASFTDALSSSAFSTPNFCRKVASLVDLEAPLNTREEEEDITEVEEESRELNEKQQADCSNEAPIRKAAENLVALSFDTLLWFAEVVSSIETSNGEDDAQSLDLFEYMTLQLKGINETEFLCKHKGKQSSEESDIAPVMPTKARRGQGRRRRQPREFQKEILPGLASLSRPWQAGYSKRSSSRKEATCLARGRRRSRSSAITVSEIHTSTLAKEQVTTGGILGWGRTTRRLRPQRILPGNV